MKKQREQRNFLNYSLSGYIKILELLSSLLALYLRTYHIHYFWINSYIIISDQKGNLWDVKYSIFRDLKYFTEANSILLKNVHCHEK